MLSAHIYRRVRMALDDTFTSYAIVTPGKELVCRSGHLVDLISALPPEGVLVKVHVAGVCHTDVHQWLGGYKLSETEEIRFAERPGYGYPVVPGHEIAGTVFSLGSGVSPGQCSLKSGDRVAVFPWLGCGQCKACEAEEETCCKSSREIGMSMDGGYSQFVIVPHYRYLVRIHSSVSYEVGSMLGCSCLTAYNALKAALLTVEKATSFSPRVAVGVLGTGCLGQWALTLARQMFKGHNIALVAIDVKKEKLEYVLQQKLTDKVLLVDPTKQPEEIIEEAKLLIDGDFHVIIDFVNNPATFGLAVGMLAQGGELVCVGLFGGTGEVQLPLIPLQRLKITGVQTGSLADFKEVVQFVQSHSLSPPPFTHYKLSEATKALQDVEKGRVGGRGVLKIAS